MIFELSARSLASADGSNHSRADRIRSIRVGQARFRMEQQFDGLYLVRMGSFKSILRQQDGVENAISMSMRGDLIGTDGACDGHCEARTLCDCDVIRIPSDSILACGRASDDLENMLYRAVSREASREMAACTLAHSSKSEVRVARFLASQSERFSQIGFSPIRFTLAMTRREIGSPLNVTLEAVRRALTSLHRLGIIDVVRRDVTILSMEGLRNYEG